MNNTFINFIIILLEDGRNEKLIHGNHYLQELHDNQTVIMILKILMLHLQQLMILRKVMLITLLRMMKRLQTKLLIIKLKIQKVC